MRVNMEPYFQSVTSPAPHDIWEKIVAQDTQAMIFQTPCWTEGLVAHGDYEDASRLYETKDGRTFVLPMVRHRSVDPALSSIASMPDGWGMGGVVTTDPFRVEDAAHVLTDIKGLPDLKVSLRVNPLQAEIWSAVEHDIYPSTQRETHILDLAGGFETVWRERFPSATRTKIRKAEKHGVEIVVGKGGELLDTFYDVYLQWIDRRAVERHMPRYVARWLGKRREPLAKFQAAAQVLGSSFQVWVAQLAGLPVAAAILLLGQHQAIYWRGASLKEVAGPVRANDLLQSRMIAAASEVGCRYYHMGESGGVESLKYFKSRFGAQLHVYPGFYRERLPIMRAQNFLNGVTRQIEQQILKV